MDRNSHNTNPGEDNLYAWTPLSHFRAFVFLVLFVTLSFVGLHTLSPAFAAEGNGEVTYDYNTWSAIEADEPRQIIVYREGGLVAPLSILPGTRPLASQSFQQGKSEVITTLVEIDDDVDLAAAIEEIKAQPGVTYAEPNYPVYLFDASYPDDEYFEWQWGLTPFDGESSFGVAAQAAWALYEDSDRKRDDQVIVAVIDSGVDINHPDLVNRVTDFGVRIIDGEESTAPEDYSADGSGHGTHIAGIIAAETNNEIGVAGITGEANVKILPVKTFRLTTSTKFDIAAGIRWAVDAGADVLNLSFGSTLFSQIEFDAIQYAIDNGVIVVAAAGNSSSRVDRVYPAAYPGVITVAATYDDGTVAEYSNYGPHIDLAAPGDEVFSTYPRELTSASPREPYGYGSGTSMATPFVAGAAALLLAADKTITPAEVYKRLIDHAIDLGPAGRDPHYGYGLLNVEAALRSTNAGPLITIDSPITGTTIVGTTTVAVKLSHPDKVSKVAFYLDDAKDNPVRTITEGIAGFISFSWTPHIDSPELLDGSHTLHAVAYDEDGEVLDHDSVDIDIIQENVTGLMLHVEAPYVDGVTSKYVSVLVTLYDVERHDGQITTKSKFYVGSTDQNGDLYLPDLPMGKEFLVVANGYISKSFPEEKEVAGEWFLYIRTIDTADPSMRGRITLDGSNARSVVPRVIKDGKTTFPDSGELWIYKEEEERTLAAVGLDWQPHSITDDLKFWVDPGTYKFLLIGHDEHNSYYLTTEPQHIENNDTPLYFEAGNPIDFQAPAHLEDSLLLRLRIDNEGRLDPVTRYSSCNLCIIPIQKQLYISPGEYNATFDFSFQIGEDRWTYWFRPIDGDGEQALWKVTPTTNSIAIDGTYDVDITMAPGYPMEASFLFNIVVTTEHEGQKYRLVFQTSPHGVAVPELIIRRVIPGSEELEDVDEPISNLSARVDSASGLFDMSKMVEGTYVPRVRIPMGLLGEEEFLVADGSPFEIKTSNVRALHIIEATAPSGEVWANFPHLMLYEVIDGEFQLVDKSFSSDWGKPIARFDVRQNNFHTDGRTFFAVVYGYSSPDTDDADIWNTVYFARFVTPDADAVARLTQDNGEEKMRQIQVKFIDHDGHFIDSGDLELYVHHKQGGIPLPEGELDGFIELNGSNKPNLYIDVGVVDIVVFSTPHPWAVVDDYQYMGVYHDLSLEEFDESDILIFDARDTSSVTVDVLPEAGEHVGVPSIMITPKDVLYTVTFSADDPLYVHNGTYQTVLNYETLSYGARWWHSIVPAEANSDGYVVLDDHEIVWSYGGGFVPQIELDRSSVRRGGTIRLNANIKDKAGNTLVASTINPEEVWYDAVRANRTVSKREQEQNTDTPLPEQTPAAVMRLVPSGLGGWQLKIIRSGESDGTVITQAIDNSPTLLLRDPNGHIVWRDQSPSYFKQATWNIPNSAPLGTYTASYFLGMGGNALYQQDLTFRVYRPDRGGEDDEEEQATQERTEPSPASETREFLSTGGTFVFHDEEVSIDVPEETFAGGSMTVRRLAERADVTGPYRPASPVYEFEPPAQPGKPVTLRIRVQTPGMNPAKLGIYRLSGDGRWTYVGGRYSDGYISTTLNHFSRYTVLAYEPVFTDMTSHWAKEDVEVLAAHHIIHGVSPGLFQPEANVTRAQAVKMLVAALWRESLESQESGTPLLYEDVPPSHWAAGVIRVATQQGIVQGDGKRFRPDDTVTREELATMIARSFSLAVGTPPDVLASFADRNDIAPWATHSVAALVERGIIQGMTPTAFVPRAFATRAQAAAMIHRMLEIGAR